MLDTEALRSLIQQAFPDWEFHYFPRLGSTNALAWELATDDCPSSALIITDEQTQGRGRGGNRWLSQPGQGLTCSIFQRCDLAVGDSGLLPLRAGIAVAHTLSEYGLAPALKWPNDILVNDHKIAGILCESRISQERITALVTGIGLNINDDISQYPEPIRSQSTSLLNETGRRNSRENLCVRLMKNYQAGESMGNSEIISTWRQLAAWQEKKVTLMTDNNQITGKFVGINQAGAARIEVDRTIKIINSGQMQRLREC